MSKYLEMYVTHTKEAIENLADKLLELEKKPDDQDVVNECFRLAHTIKGMAATMAFKNTAELAHSMESIMDAIRSNRLERSDEVMDLLFQCVDRMDAMTEVIKAKKPEPDASELMDKITVVLQAIKPETEEAVPQEEEKPKKKAPSKKEEEEAPPAEGGKDLVGLTVDMAQNTDMPSARAMVVIKRIESKGKIEEINPSIEDIENEKFGRRFTAWIDTAEDPEKLIKELSGLKFVAKVTRLDRAVRAKPEKKEPAKAAPAEKAEKTAAPQPAADIVKKPTQEVASVRVKMDRLDDLMDSIGELVINKIRLSEISKQAGSENLSEALRALDRLTSELQYNVLRIRMVPIEMVFSKFPRMVRDLSKQEGKDVELMMFGQDIELDRTVIDKLGDLLVHLLRNSIDHGIETPSDRAKAGKPKIGAIRLSASQEQNRVVIRVEDDGKGIDLDKVRRKAVEKGLYTQEQVTAMSDEDAMGIIATPGFSTADKVTAVSGRGVGMDAVKTGVESFGGQMTIESVKGSWTRVTIRLPLTLAIILAMMVKVGNEIYAISIDPIVETISLGERDVKSIGGMNVIKFRDEIVPLIHLSQLLGISSEATGSKVIIVEIGQRKTGLVVDELLGQQEIVVKPLDKYLRRVKFLGGATILGSGEVALILDLLGLSIYAREQMKRAPIDSQDIRTAGGTANA